jgi:hypothetical protein
MAHESGKKKNCLLQGRRRTLAQKGIARKAIFIRQLGGSGSAAPRHQDKGDAALKKLVLELAWS